MDQTLRRVATKEREEIKGTAKQKMARRHNKEGGNHLEQGRTMEGINEGQHPVVDEQSPGEGKGEGGDIKMWSSEVPITMLASKEYRTVNVHMETTFLWQIHFIEFSTLNIDQTR